MYESAGPNLIERERAKSVMCELKILYWVWEHGSDPSMFALKILLMVLNKQDDLAKLLN